MELKKLWRQAWPKIENGLSGYLAGLLAGIAGGSVVNALSREGIDPLSPELLLSQLLFAILAVLVMVLLSLIIVLKNDQKEYTISGEKQVKIRIKEDGSMKVYAPQEYVIVDHEDE